MDGMRGLRPSMIFTVADGAAKHPCGYLNNNHPILAIEHKRRYAHLGLGAKGAVLRSLILSSRFASGTM